MLNITLLFTFYFFSSFVHNDIKKRISLMRIIDRKYFTRKINRIWLFYKWYDI